MNNKNNLKTNIKSKAPWFVGYDWKPITGAAIATGTYSPTDGQSLWNLIGVSYCKAENITPALDISPLLPGVKAGLFTDVKGY
jgi:hypothetical protein